MSGALELDDHRTRARREHASHALAWVAVGASRHGHRFALQNVLLYDSQSIHGIPCFGSGLAGTELRFDERERIRRFVLSEPYSIGGCTYSRGTRLTLADDGRVTAVRRINVNVALYTTRPAVHRTARGASDGHTTVAD